MAIKNIVTSVTGLVGVTPRVIYIDTDDTLATVTTAGYLNKAVQQGFSFNEADMACVTTKTTPSAAATEVAWLEVSKSGSDWSLVAANSPGEVVLPTVANYIAHFANTTGTLSSAAANIINAGNIQAGLSGTAGTLASYPATALRGALILAGVANTGNTNVTISNAAHGQATVISIPDGGQATAEFIISDSAGIQHITSGSLNIDAGSIITGLAAGGSAGSYIGYSNTAAMGSLRLLTVDNAGDFAVTISNASHGQASVISIPDGGQATTEFIIADSAGTQHITSGAFQVDAGAVSSGLAAGGAAGNFVAWANTTASGNLALLAVDNASGDFDTVISNAAAVGQDQTVTIPDGGAADSQFVLSQSAAPTNNVAFTKVVTPGFADLATAGTFTVQAAPSATSQFAVLDIKVLNSTGLSGGGGDRLLELTDGTIGFSDTGITAALLGTPVCTVWGGTGNPIAAGASQVSTAGDDLVLQYTGGTTDYTAGEVQLAITLVQVTA